MIKNNNAPVTIKNNETPVKTIDAGVPGWATVGIAVIGVVGVGEGDGDGVNVAVGVADGVIVKPTVGDGETGILGARVTDGLRVGVKEADGVAA